MKKEGSMKEIIAPSGNMDIENKLEKLKELIGNDPLNQANWKNLRKSVAANVNDEDALKLFLLYTEKYPDLPYPLNELGICYSKLNRYDVALGAFKKAIDIDKDYAAPWYNLGLDYDEQTQYNEAIEAYKKFIELEPEDASVWFNLGYAYFNQTQYNEAETISNGTSLPRIGRHTRLAPDVCQGVRN